MADETGNEGTSKPRGKRPPKKIDVQELAVILAYAAIHTDKAAAEKFGTTTRTIQRHREAIREGKAPELERLVAERKAAAAERCADLLTETYEMSLRRLQELLPQADFAMTLSAAEKLGEQRITRGFFSEPETDSTHPRNGAAPGSGSGGAGGEASEDSAPVH